MSADNKKLEKALETGRNDLFSDPNCEKLRAAFREKSRARIPKVTNAKDAVKTLLSDGDYLAIGGFGANRIPTAVLHEIVRQKKKDLGFAGHTATHDFQVLMAGGNVSRCDIAYIVGLEARGLSPNARRIVQSGAVKLTEWTNAALSWRIKAAAMGLPFLPARIMLGTDTFKYSAAKEITCPYTGQKLTALPALSPDFACIHVHEADIYGNCRILGASVSDEDLAKAAKRVVITTEKIIPTDEIRSAPEATTIPFWCVDAVVEVPFGSYPGNMPGCYFSDEAYLKNWMKTEKDPEAFEKFFREQILETRDFNEYLNKNGGLEKIVKLRADEHLIPAQGEES